jgi:outer membrane protein assembly factor BamB
MGSSSVTFAISEDRADRVTISFGGNTIVLDRVTEKDSAEKDSADKQTGDVTVSKEFLPDTAESLLADRTVSSANWPSFRGTGARGIAEGQSPPCRWNVVKDEHVKWKVSVAGLGLSCPVIWGDHIYLTSAVADNPGQLKIGLYGNVDSVEDDAVYAFKVYCFDKDTGDVIWERTARETKPAIKRHAKSSHANPTMATDGEHVVAFFGSEGLYCYDSSGELIWSRDLGVLDSGWFYDPGYQWGFGSSPIIFGKTVIVQCDIHQGSFVAALNIETGEDVWRVSRQEIPSWSTPTVHEFDGLPMLLTHGTRRARGYDARDGKLLWELGEHSEIVVPTPFVAHNLIYLTSGYSPVQPIYAVKGSASGDISLRDGAQPSEHIAWNHQRGGPYLPTPIVYGDYLYTCGNNGVLTCYTATTGETVYRQRMRAPGGTLSFTASPIAGNGHLYFGAEDGRILVVKAGPKYELKSTNETGEHVLATPAISEGVFYIRSQMSLIAVSENE